MSWHDHIREARERAHLSQSELAEKVGCSQATINKIENEKPQSSRYLLEIINQLNLSTADFPANAFGNAQRLASGERMARGNPQVNESKNSSYKAIPSSWASALDLYGEVPLYIPKNFVDEMYEIQFLMAGTVKRPPFLHGIKGAYALSTDDETMIPECEPGDILFVNPHQVITPDCLCAFYSIGNNEHEDTYLQIKRFVGQTDKSWKVAQHNPADQREIPKDSWTERHRIVAKIFR